MPYAVPAERPVPFPSASASTPTPTSPRLGGHRRSRSSTSSTFSDERGPGAFVSLGSLPRSQKRAVFHIDLHDDEDEDSASRPAAPLATRSYSSPLAPTNSLRLSMNAGRFSPSVEPPTRIEIPSSTSLAPDSVPFPASSPLSPTDHASPFLPTLAHSHSNSNSSDTSVYSLPRTPSSPIILSNGKPLKSSLKSSCSSPNILGLPRATSKHLRAQSAPSTPAGAKNVHFADKDSGLETVRVFSRSGKPASLSKPPGEETETETEAENSNVSSYPFPSLSQNEPPLHEIDSNPSRTSAVPSSAPSPYANVHVETLTLPRTRPPALRGTVLVRNMHFEKRVAVRFTLDDWQTTSEVTCRHVVSLPSLPPPFPHEHRNLGDLAASIANGQARTEDENRPGWDRFSFTIRLEDYAHKLSDRTLYLVARFSPGTGGEWWDNNSGQNYKIGFRRAPPSPSIGSMGFGAVGSGSFGGVTAQQRSFNAPTTLRTTPMTGEHHGKVHASLLMRSTSSPFPMMSMQPPAKHEKEEAVSPVQDYISRKLSLSNYVAPSTTASMVTPPTTPPGSVRVRRSSLPGDAGTHADMPEQLSGEDSQDTEAEEGNDEATERGSSPEPKSAALPPPPLAIIGGQPATTVDPSASATLSVPSRSSALEPLDFKTSFGNMNAFGSEMGVGSEKSGAQLLSPPGSPARNVSPLPLGLSGLSLGGSGDSGSTTPTDTVSPGSPNASPAAASPLDSSYAALIRQWCFTGSPSGSSPQGTIPSASAAPSAAFGSAPGFGRGYGLPGFGFGGMMDAGMVGARMH